MKIQRMKTNRIVNPLGFDLKTPHVSWTVTDTEAKKQLWARVEVSKTEDFADVIFDTGACKTASSLGVPVEIALEPRTRYFWRVTVMGDNGELVTSDTAWFGTAKLDEPFTAQRISPCLAPDTAPYMRRAFEITGEVLSARAYFTGLGIYELYLNGEKANDEYLAPGCTAYDSWIQYQTYDVTDLIHTGENVIGAILGNGWAKGRFGFDGVVGDYETNFPGKPCNMYTDEYLLFGELHVTTTQGETVIVTDESWQCAPNPLTFGNIYDGERYDANRNRKLVRAVLHLCKLAAGEAQHHDEPRRNFRAPLAARKSKAYHHPEADHHAEKRACVRPRPEHYGLVHVHGRPARRCRAARADRRAVAG